MVQGFIWCLFSDAHCLRPCIWINCKTSISQSVSVLHLPLHLTSLTLITYHVCAYVYFHGVNRICVRSQLPRNQLRAPLAREALDTNCNTAMTTILVYITICSITCWPLHQVTLLGHLTRISQLIWYQRDKSAGMRGNCVKCDAVSEDECDSVTSSWALMMTLTQWHYPDSGALTVKSQEKRDDVLRTCGADMTLNPKL